MNPFEFLKKALSPKPIKALPRDAILIDVRSPAEFAGGSIPGAIHIPLNQIHLIASHQSQIDASKPIIVFCASGMRSGLARRQLLSMGHVNVINGGGLTSLAAQLSLEKNRT